MEGATGSKNSVTLKIATFQSRRFLQALRIEIFIGERPNFPKHSPWVRNRSWLTIWENKDILGVLLQCYYCNCIEKALQCIEFSMGCYCFWSENRRVEWCHTIRFSTTIHTFCLCVGFDALDSWLLVYTTVISGWLLLPAWYSSWSIIKAYSWIAPRTFASSTYTHSKREMH